MFSLSNKIVRHGFRAALCSLAIGALIPAGQRPSVAAQTLIGAALHESAGALTRETYLDALPAMTFAERKAAHAVPRPADGLTDKQYVALKTQLGNAPLTAVRPELRGSAPSGFVDPNTPGGRGFNGLTESCSDLTPSDMALATGTTYVVQAINSCIAVYNKNGSLQSGYPKSFNRFLGLPSSAFTFDPRALYDWYGQRYILTIDQFDSANNQGFVWVAVSASGDPRGAWHIYRVTFGTSGQSAPDFPTVGQDRQGIYVAANVFGTSGGNFTNFLGNQLYLLPKKTLYSGKAWTAYYYTNLFANGKTLDSLQPVNVSDNTSQPRAEFLLGSFNITGNGGQCSKGCNGIATFAIANPLVASGSPGPELSGTVVATAHSYALPPGARQKGGGSLIDTGDTRISGTTAYSAGNLYGSLNTRNNAGQTSVLWFELHPTLGDNNARCTGRFIDACADIAGAAMVNEDCYYCNGQGTNGSNFYGTLQPDPEGNVTMVYAYSDDTFYPGVAYTSRRVTNAANAMHDSGIFLSTGLGNYGQGRWGDYTGISLDQSGVTEEYKWFSGMYSASNGNWNTAIGVNGYNAPNQP